MGKRFDVSCWVSVCVLIWETVCCSRADEQSKDVADTVRARRKNMKMKYRAREKYTHSTVQVAETAQHWKLESPCASDHYYYCCCLCLCCCCCRRVVVVFGSPFAVSALKNVFDAVPMYPDPHTSSSTNSIRCGYFVCGNCDRGSYENRSANTKHEE